MSESAITLRCMNGFSLRVSDANLIVISKRTEETFPIPGIQSFSFKEPRGISPGSITFRTAQAATTGVNIGLGIGLALGAEHNFFFQKADLETARRVRDYVTGYKSRQESNPSDDGGTVVSVVDEIRGLKSLLDDGILTQEEFDAKKRQLLGI